jgi:hypothetical protein
MKNKQATLSRPEPLTKRKSSSNSTPGLSHRRQKEIVSGWAKPVRNQSNAGRPAVNAQTNGTADQTKSMGDENGSQPVQPGKELLASLGGTIVRHDDGWRWSDGSLEPKIKDLTLGEIFNFAFRDGIFIEVPVFKAELEVDLAWVKTAPNTG